MMTFQCKETLAYFAGILDGEGTFTIIVNKRTSHTIPWHGGAKRTGRGFQLIPNISFAMKSEEMIEWARSTFGGIAYDRKVGGMYGWRLQEFEAIANLIPQLLPYLKLKREQAEIVLAFVQHRQEQELKDGHFRAPYDDVCFSFAEKVRLQNNGKHKYSAEELKTQYITV